MKFLFLFPLLSLAYEANRINLANNKSYLAIYGKIDKSEASKLCSMNDNDQEIFRLARLESNHDFNLLSQIQFDEEKTSGEGFWIENWRDGDNFVDHCISFFEGGAIVVPLGNCNSKQSVLCEVFEK